VRAPERQKPSSSDIGSRTSDRGQAGQPAAAQLAASYEDKKRADAEARRLKKEADARQRRVDDLESRIGRAEAEIKELEAKMAAPGFYEDHVGSRPVIDRHQALMWEVGDLMNKWEALQSETKV